MGQQIIIQLVFESCLRKMQLRLYSITLHYHQPLLFTNFTGFRLSNAFTSKLLPLLIVSFSQDRPHTSHQLLTLIIHPDLSVLPHSVCYMFLSPPRPSVAKPSGSQLLRFETLFHKISGYYHPLALSNAVSKLTSFPTTASHIPHLAIRQRL